MDWLRLAFSFVMTTCGETTHGGTGWQPSSRSATFTPRTPSSYGNSATVARSSPAAIDFFAYRMPSVPTTATCLSLSAFFTASTTPSAMPSLLA